MVIQDVELKKYPMDQLVLFLFIWTQKPEIQRGFLLQLVMDSLLFQFSFPLVLSHGD